MINKTKLINKKKRKKNNKSETEVDETSDHPFHEPYTQLEHYKE